MIKIYPQSFLYGNSFRHSTDFRLNPFKFSFQSFSIRSPTKNSNRMKLRKHLQSFSCHTFSRGSLRIIPKQHHNLLQSVPLLRIIPKLIHSIYSNLLNPRVEFQSRSNMNESAANLLKYFNPSQFGSSIRINPKYIVNFFQSARPIRMKSK